MPENMKKIGEYRQALAAGDYNERLMQLYCCGKEACKPYADRYLTLLDHLEETFGAKEEAALFSAPGRTEIGGNQIDHQHGRVLAGSVNMDMIAAVGTNDLGLLRVLSEGYPEEKIDLADLTARAEEENTSASILRGTCKAFADRGAVLTGLDVYISSNVPKGSGISSSAAFEVLLGNILNELCMAEKLDAVEIAKIGQWVENVYFGKPCGLLDQMACNVGNIITIDFKDPASPIVEPVDVDFGGAGLALCLLDSGADHAELTGEYAAVPAECGAVAQMCGKTVLRDLPYEEFMEQIPALRKELGDRPVMRAFHFYADNNCVPQQVEALRRNDFDTFLRLIDQSGHSSWECVQNVIPCGYKDHQDMGLTITLAKNLLKGRGAVRVHGGGFAGTVQAFVPLDMLDEFKAGAERVLGEGKCHVLSIRPVGGVML